MIETKGKANIVARVIADSISAQRNRLTTWEVEYPRLIHSELMTHRMFSRNAASSRAIPFTKMMDQLNGRPVRFGANQSGMQDKGEDHTTLVVVWDQYAERDVELSPQDAWEYALDDIKPYAEAFAKAGYHKQITGRLTEPFQMMKTIISATETDNFFWLRDDKAADPSIAELARVMKESYEQSVPELLQAGDYHLPYIGGKLVQQETGEIMGYSMNDWPDFENGENFITLEEAIKVSCARCAAVSYRNEGYGLEKSLEVYENLVGGDRKHASAFEHCATPMQELVQGITNTHRVDTWEDGVTHMDKDYQLWSGNFKGFIQYRKLIPNENYHAPTRP